MAASRNVKKTNGTQTIFGANHKVVGNIAAEKNSSSGLGSLVAPLALPSNWEDLCPSAFYARDALLREALISDSAISVETINRIARDIGIHSTGSWTVTPPAGYDLLKVEGIADALNRLDHWGVLNKVGGTMADEAAITRFYRDQLFADSLAYQHDLDPEMLAGIVTVAGDLVSDPVADVDRCVSEDFFASSHLIPSLFGQGDGYSPAEVIRVLSRGARGSLPGIEVDNARDLDIVMSATGRGFSTADLDDEERTLWLNPPGVFIHLGGDSWDAAVAHASGNV
jgi:hypothetical protein